MTTTDSFEAFAAQVDYSLLESLQADPESSSDGDDHQIGRSSGMDRV